MPEFDSTSDLPFDLFISYAHTDNQNGWITALIAAIKAEHSISYSRELRIFFDTHVIEQMSDWQLHILKGLKQSKIFLAIVSPAYFASAYCQKEWRIFLEHEVARSLLEGGGGLAAVYYLEVPGFSGKGRAPAPEITGWVADIRRRQLCDARSWSTTGLAALQRADVRERLRELVNSMEARIDRVNRASRSVTTVAPYNPNFVGRVDDLRALRHTLEEKRVGAITAVQGIGGIGKTELAFAYAHAYADVYPGGRYLISCEKLCDFRDVLLRLADQSEFGLPLSADERSDLDRLASRVRAHLAGLGQALLVLDNVDHAELLDPAKRDRVLPDRKQAHVLATTQLDIQSLGGVECLCLDALPPNDAIRLLERHRPFASDEEFNSALHIVQLLGGHALACEVVAVYLRDNPSVTCTGYLSDLERDIPAALGYAGAHTDELTGVDYRALLQRHTQPLIRLLLKPTLDSLTPAARAILDCAALLAPDSISLPWIREVAEARLAPQLQRASAGLADPWAALIQRLTGLRLLIRTEDDRLVRMHRVLRAVVLEAMDAPQRVDLDARFISKAMERAAAYHRGSVPAEWLWEVRMLSVLVTHWLPRGTSVVADMGTMVSTAALSLGEMNTARRLGYDAEQIRGKLARAAPHDSELQREWSVALSNIGNLALREGKSDEARHYFQQSLQITERLARESPEDPVAQRGWSVSLNKMGELAMREGKTGEARKFFQHGLQIVGRLAQKEPTTLGAQRDLSVMLERMGDLAVREGKSEEARRCFQLSLQIREVLARALPGDVAAQQGLLVSLNKKGELALREGKTEEARQLFHQGLKIAERLAQLLPHDVVAQRNWSVSLEKLGDLAAREGKTDEARQSFQQGLKITERLAQLLPQDVGAQLDWSVCLNRVGDLGIREGKMAEAQQVFQQGQHICERLARDYPGNVRAQRELCVFHDKLGDLAMHAGQIEEARGFFQRYLHISERLGRKFPADVEAQRDWFISLNKMGNLLVRDRKIDEGRGLFQQARRIAESLARTLPDDVEAQRGWSISIERMGDLAVRDGKTAQARQLFQLSMNIREGLARALPDDVEAQRGWFASLERMGDLAMSGGRVEEARRFFHQELQIAERLARISPDAVDARYDLFTSHFRLAHLATRTGELDVAITHRAACSATLEEMRRRGMPFDDSMRQLLVFFACK